MVGLRKADDHPVEINNRGVDLTEEEVDVVATQIDEGGLLPIVTGIKIMLVPPLGTTKVQGLIAQVGIL